MPLYVKDPQVDVLADELAALTRTTKTEAVRQALQNEIAHEKGKADLVEQSVAFVRQLRGHRRMYPKTYAKGHEPGITTMESTPRHETGCTLADHRLRDGLSDAVPGVGAGSV